MELLPTKATFRPGEPVEVELRRLEAPTTVTLRRLHEQVDEQVVAPDDPVARFGALDEGGYGVDAGGASTALDVLANPFARLRYGFVSHYEAGREAGGVADNVRRLHLNAVQFYDWMYRHAELLPPADEFEDALGRPVSLATVRALARAVRNAGSAPLGYAAVYAAGTDHWPAWQTEGLYHADGSPWTLGDDFLWNVDPSSDRWLTHFAAQLAAARDAVGFAGFHLDQFGAPKRAQRLDGSVVDLAEAFPMLIERVRGALPDARLIFNNVNDFPTWTTASAPQDAVYIEVWSPHDRLDHLGGLVARARALAPGKAVALAAYLTVYDGDAAAARAAMRYELATVLSHGGSCLLHGEEDAVLTDPYYVRHRRMDAESVEVARRYADFGVRYGDLLYGAIDVTRSHTGGVNVEVQLDASTDCEPGALWVRVLDGGIVSLIDLRGQSDVRWDAPKAEPRPGGAVTIAFERAGPAPRFFFASPEDAPAAVELAAAFDGRYDRVEVPPFRAWALVWAAVS